MPAPAEPAAPKEAPASSTPSPEDLLRQNSNSVQSPAQNKPNVLNPPVNPPAPQINNEPSVAPGVNQPQSPPTAEPEEKPKEKQQDNQTEIDLDAARKAVEEALGTAPAKDEAVQSKFENPPEPTLGPTPPVNPAPQHGYMGQPPQQPQGPPMPPQAPGWTRKPAARTWKYEPKPEFSATRSEFPPKSIVNLYGRITVSK